MKLINVTVKSVHAETDTVSLFLEIKPILLDVEINSTTSQDFDIMWINMTLSSVQINLQYNVLYNISITGRICNKTVTKLIELKYSKFSTETINFSYYFPLSEYHFPLFPST